MQAVPGKALALLCPQWPPQLDPHCDSERDWEALSRRKCSFELGNRSSKSRSLTIVHRPEIVMKRCAVFFSEISRFLGVRSGNHNCKLQKSRDTKLQKPYLNPLLRMNFLGSFIVLDLSPIHTQVGLLNRLVVISVPKISTGSS